MDPLEPRTLDYDLTERVDEDQVLNISDVSIDYQPPSPPPPGPVINYPREETKFSTTPLPTRGVTWFTGISTLIVTGVVMSRTEINNSCPIDGICTLFRLLARATEYSFETLFKSVSYEGQRVENAIKGMFAYDKAVVMTPPRSERTRIMERNHDTGLKKMWCDLLSIGGEAFPNGRYLIDVTGNPGSRVTQLLNPVRNFTRSYECLCPFLTIQRTMGNFRIKTQKQRHDFENGLWDLLPDYAPNVACDKCKTDFKPTNSIFIPSTTWILFVNINDRKFPLEKPLDAHEFKNKIVINGETFVKTMSFHHIDPPTLRGIGHATYGFYSQGNSFYYDSMEESGNIRPIGYPAKAEFEKIVYIRLPEKATNAPPPRVDRFHLGP